MSENNKDKDFAPINVELSDRIPMASQRQGTSRPPQVITKSSNGLVSFLILCTVVAVGGCAYLFWLQQNQAKIAEITEQRIQSLESKLSATGEEMGNSTVALQVKVTELSNRAEESWAQIDKLWASAWRRNQAEIKALDTNLGGFQKDVNKVIKEAESKVAASLTQVKQLQQRLDGVNSKVTAQANDILTINVEKEGLQSTINKQNTELRQMAEKLILLEKRNTNLLQKLQQLEAKLNEVVSRAV